MTKFGIVVLLTVGILNIFCLPVHGAEQLTSEELFQGLRDGRFQALVDVRNRLEWDRGHIENATLLEGLNRFNTSGEIATPDDIAGCKNCSIAVYCNSGSRAGQAITILENAGFTGPLYNGLGVLQWGMAGYDLVNTSSFDPACKVQGTCCELRETACELVVSDTEAPTGPPTEAPAVPPSIMPTGPPSEIPVSPPTGTLAGSNTDNPVPTGAPMSPPPSATSGAAADNGMRLLLGVSLALGAAVAKG